MPKVDSTLICFAYFDVLNCRIIKNQPVLPFYLMRQNEDHQFHQTNQKEKESWKGALVFPFLEIEKRIARHFHGSIPKKCRARTGRRSKKRTGEEVGSQ